MRDSLLHKEIGIAANLDRIGHNGYKGYPSGTKSSTFRQFSLLQGRDTVLDIGWIDYKGGLLTGDASDGSEQEDLYHCLEKSTAIVIYLDGYRIASAENIKQARRFVGTEPIAKIISHFESSKQRSMVNILIVLTQCDAIEDARWIGAGDYGPLKEKTKEVLGGLVDMARRNPLWRCGMVAISAVGRGNNRRTFIQDATFSTAPVVSDEIIGEPEPFNIVQAFYWLVGCVVAAEKVRAQGRVAALHGRLSAQKSDEARLVNMGFWKRLFYNDGKWNDEVHSSKRAQEQLSMDILGENQQLQAYEQALIPLFRESDKVVTAIS
ncbi:MAG: hypothetical protein LBR88_10515 [Zoogloeaceae bacterium]|nr:hypothetical protein [Zoogloeaceae bacterium]